MVALLSGCSSAPIVPGGLGYAQQLPDRPGLSHVARVAPGLYRGAQPDAAGYEALRGMGVRTVISFRNHTSTESEAKAAGLNYIAIPIHAWVTSEPPTDAQVAKFFRVIRDPDQQPVFWHCAHGRDRTGAMTAIYRIEVEGWSHERALAEMQAFGFRDLFQDLKAFVENYRPRGL